MNEYRQKSKQYLDTATEFVKTNLRDERIYDEEMKHLCTIAASVMMTRDKYMAGGGFVQAVVDNDLAAAVGRADDTCIKGLRILVLVKLWCHIKE